MKVDFLIFSFFLNRCGCLTLESLKVPTEGMLGGSVVFECEFKLGHKPLYSVKWYKDDEEIYRFMPDSKPITKSFPKRGFSIDEFNSNMHKLTLANLTGDANGIYKCEVSTEGPLFETVFQKSNMTIIAFPDRDPILTVDKFNYEVGEDIFANCTSGRSFPITNLTWYINGKKVDKKCINEEGAISVGFGRFRSFSRIRIKIRGDPGTMILSCEGKISKNAMLTDSKVILKITKPTKYNFLINEKSSCCTLNLKFSILIFLVCILKL